MTEDQKEVTETQDLKVVTADADIKTKVPDVVDIVFSRDGAEVSRITTGNNAMALYNELDDSLCDDLKSCDVEIVSDKVKDGVLKGTREEVAKALAADVLSPERLIEEIKGFVDTVTYRTPARMVSVIVHLGEENPSPVCSKMSESIPISVGDCNGFVKTIDALRHDLVERLSKSGIEVDDDKNLIVPATTMPKGKQ